MGIVQKAGSKIAGIFKKKKEETTTVVPETKSVVVTDFSEGSSIQTETVTTGGSQGSSGQTTTNKTYRGSGGSSVTPAQQTAMDVAKAKLDESQANKLSSGEITPTDNSPAWETTAGKKLNRELGALSLEDTQQEFQLRDKVKSYANTQFNYYQNLINRGQLTVDEAQQKYEEEVNKYQENLIYSENERRNTAYKNVIDKNKIIYVGEFQDIIDNTPLTPPTTTWQKIKDVGKAVYVASPFGIHTRVSESNAEELDKARTENTINSLLFFGGGNKIPDTIPFKTALSVVREEREGKYTKEQKEKLAEDLDLIIDKLPDPLKYDVQQAGFKALEKKGVKFFPDFVVDEKTGEVSKVYSLSGEEFERKINENILTGERAKKTKGKLDNVMVFTRSVSTKALEFYSLFKGMDYAFAKGKLAYETLGGGLTIEGVTALETGEGIITAGKVQSGFKNVQLAEGIVRVPRSYKGLKITAGLFVAGLYGYEKVKQYKEYSQISSEYGKTAFWSETIGELGGFELATGSGGKAVNWLKNEYENIGLEKVSQADITQAGFIRSGDRVYMSRYGGFKLSKPKTWLKSAKINYAVDQRTGEIYAQSMGTPRGSFVKRQYKFLPDELVAYYKYGGEVQVYGKSGELKRIVKAEAFPFDDPKTHYDWFVNRNIKEYPVPIKSKLPIKVKGKGFGYSATGETWMDVEFTPMNIYYDGGKNVLTTKGAVQYYSGKGVSGGFLRIFGKGTEESVVGKIATSPRIYAGYFNKIRINKAIREIKGFTNKGMELKAYLFRKPTGIAGTGNIPLLKREVELVTEIEKRIPIRKRFKIKLEGWSVPIEEQIFTSSSSDLSARQLKAIIKEVGKVEEITTPQFSSLPSKMKNRKSPIPSLSVSQKTSSINSVLSQIKSSISSSLSYSKLKYSILSKSKSRSSVKPSSYTSGFSSSFFSGLSYSPLSSPTYPQTPSKSYSSLFLTPKLSGKLTKKKKLKKSIWELGLLPDFTAKAIGLPSPEFSIKDIEKQLLKVQTGIDVRTGGRIKWA